MKRRIKQNRYDNWYGNEGGKRVAAFGNTAEASAEENANAWKNAEPKKGDNNNGKTTV